VKSVEVMFMSAPPGVGFVAPIKYWPPGKELYEEPEDVLVK
jgi:hypothetical protein